jgi:hypothetical protein
MRLSVSRASPARCASCLIVSPAAFRCGARPGSHFREGCLALRSQRMVGSTPLASHTRTSSISSVARWISSRSSAMRLYRDVHWRVRPKTRAISAPLRPASDRSNSMAARRSAASFGPVRLPRSVDLPTPATAASKLRMSIAVGTAAGGSVQPAAYRSWLRCASQRLTCTAFDCAARRDITGRSGSSSAQLPQGTWPTGQAKTG